MLFVLIDTLRAEHLRTYGYTPPDQPVPRSPRRAGPALRPPPEPVVVDEVLDGLALDRPVPAALRRDALRRRAARRGEDGGRRCSATPGSAPRASGATAGSRAISDSTRASISTRARAAAAHRPRCGARNPTLVELRRNRHGRRRGRARVPAHLRPRALVPLSAPDGRARVHLRRRRARSSAPPTPTCTTTRPAREPGARRAARACSTTSGHLDRHAVDRRLGSRRGVRRARQRGPRAQRLSRGHRGAAHHRASRSASRSPRSSPSAPRTSICGRPCSICSGCPPLEGVDGRSRVPEILAAARGEPGPTTTRSRSHTSIRPGVSASRRSRPTSR